MIINKFESKDEALERATQELNKLLESRKQDPTLLLLSGGSALELLKGIDKNNLGDHLTISVLDERYSFDENVNTFAQISKLKFYLNAEEKGCGFIDTRPQENESQEKLTNRFESGLKKWIENNPDGKIIATQGISPDGHTAGIMPFPEDPERFQQLFENEKWVVDYNAEGKNPYPLRVTTTLSFLRDFVDFSIVFVCGEEKQKALENVILEDGKLNETPAIILKDMKEVQIFTDI